MRGEYPTTPDKGRGKRELPPRARRIRNTDHVADAAYGTTSACAENTLWTRANPTKKGNYLRVRGEYELAFSAEKEVKELPPRARRIRQQQTQSRHYTGTTSACAENTVSTASNIFSFRNYLRVRGEYKTVIKLEGEKMELPPRARRILQGNTAIPHRRGTTSACAENTPRTPGA